MFTNHRLIIYPHGQSWELNLLLSCFGLSVLYFPTAGEVSYWPGKLIFTGVINRIILLTLAGEFPIFYCKWEGLLVTKSEKQYFFVWKSEKSLLFRVEKWKIVTFLYWKVPNSKSKINPSLLLTGEHFFSCRGRKMVPTGQASLYYWTVHCTVSIFSCGLC